MSTAVHEVSRLPFLVPNEEIARSAFQVSRGGAFRMELPRVVPASRLEDRPAPTTVMTGIAALDALTGGLPRGGVTEICGLASSGRTSVVLALMAAMTSGFFRSPALAKTGLGRGTHGNPIYPELC